MNKIDIERGFKTLKEIKKHINFWDNARIDDEFFDRCWFIKDEMVFVGVNTQSKSYDWDLQYDKLYPGKELTGAFFDAECGFSARLIILDNSKKIEPPIGLVDNDESGDE